MAGDDATLLVSESIDFPETGRIARITVWAVPESDAYPDGIKYRMHYGTVDGDTLLRYDNSHPETKGHERHTRDGVDEEYEFPGGYRALLRRFQREIQDHERD